MKRLVKLMMAMLFCMVVVSGSATVEAKTVKAASTKTETVEYKVKKTTVNEKKTIYVGSKVQFKVGKKVLKLAADKNSKSKVSIAKDGTVTFKATGSVKLTGKSGSKKYTIKVSVQKAGLEVTSKTLNKNKNFTIKVNGAVAKSYEYSGSVVSVSNKGKVTAKKAGTVTIKVKCTNGKTYKCEVTVKDTKLSKDNLTLYVGKTHILKIEGTDSKVKWSSSKPSVASVSSKGKVTAKKAGTTTIKAKVDGKTLQCKVTVKKAELNATKIELWDGQTFQLELKGATIAKCESEDKYGDIVTVTDKGLITGVGYYGNDTTTITVIDTDGNKYKCKASVKCGKITGCPETVKVGSSFQLKFKGPKVVKWWVEDKDAKVATVSKSGKVTIIWQETRRGESCRVYCKDEFGTEQYVSFDVNEHEHEWKEVRVIKEPTLYSKGVKLFVCKHCDKEMEYDYCLPIEVDLGNGKTETIYGYWDLEAGEEMCRLLNEYRKSLGLNELETNDDFMEFARVRAAECGVLYEHKRPNGGDNPGEVISTYETAESAIEAWKKSEGHNNTLTWDDALYSAGAIFFQYEVDEEYGWQRCTHEYSVMNLYNQFDYEGFYEGIYDPIVLP